METLNKGDYRKIISINDTLWGPFSIIHTTVEPLNKGHVGTKSFALYREVSFIRRLKCTGIGMRRFVLYKEVFFIRSVLYRRFHCSTF